MPRSITNGFVALASDIRTAMTALAGAASVIVLTGVNAAQAQVQPGAPVETAKTPASGKTDDEDIVVVGMTKTDQRKAVSAYVDRLTEMSSYDPLARYEPGIYCPVVFGLASSRNAEIAARMHRVAAAAGVKPAPPGCVASAMVFFVDDKEDFLKTFAERQPIFFANFENHRPPFEKGPTTAWQLLRDFDDKHSPLGDKGQGQGPRVVSSFIGGGRLNSMMTRAVAASVVIIERKSLLGLSVTQIADYALMRSLTDRGPGKLDKANRITVLSVLEAAMESVTAKSITAWDLAYLKARYSGDPRIFGVRQGSAIRASMKRVWRSGSKNKP